MNVLTFDIEDWFHIKFDDEFTKDSVYSSFEPRLEKRLNMILDKLDESKTEATFLCLGWIGEKYPNLIKEISSRGHEVGSHTHMHKLVNSQTKAEFDEDLKKSIGVLSNITSKQIITFRAPAFSIGKNNNWAFEVLHKNGIEIDLSIFPAKRDFGGYSDNDTNKPHWIEINGIKLKEYPINPWRFGKKPVIYSGGGYFRIIPYNLAKSFFRHQKYNMAYFHARDFDPDQPILSDLSLARKLKSYYGLKSSWTNFSQLLTDFDFISIRQADKLINWHNAPLVSIKS